MPVNDPRTLGGWRHDPAEVHAILRTLPFPAFGAAARNLFGSGANKTTLLYKAWKEVNNGEYISYPAQTIGDCVSQGHGHGVDLLAAVQIAIGNKSEKFVECCTEAVYGMCRVDIGGGQLGSQDGAVGAWAAKAVSTLGTVGRDVTGPYDGQRAKAWGSSGVPADLDRAALQHKVETVSLVNTFDELADALANGYPVTVCSGQGFSMQRDDQGFCRPEGSWQHCMLWVGTREDRPGACCFQSWGPATPKGPLDLDQPPNSFWVERSVVERMLQCGDSWAMSSFDGYETQPLPDRWSWTGFA